MVDKELKEQIVKFLLINKGIILSTQTVRKYMNMELCLKSITRKKKRSYIPGSDPYALFENLLNQNFTADSRNAKWCVDFTYIYFGRKKRYNCTIIDLYDRRVVASVILLIIWVFRTTQQITMLQ